MILNTGATGTTGRDIADVPVTPEQFRRGALAAGLPGWLVETPCLLDETFASGRAAVVNDAAREITKAEPRTFDRFACDHTEALKGAAV